MVMGLHACKLPVLLLPLLPLLLLLLPLLLLLLQLWRPHVCVLATAHMV
jgi:hypothetical protein